ncbi:MAG: hypothetical protein COV44_00900 [Deltaproteobacteria bacterium CG11_big_fil_rev_8_21_14_0_20_45_16]|nr:MAG: hypothetical protein COV44_00900 [Deltaproteobacteria bacterium CG11_big_fil_rev_8_21_14_0_20_45_16]
MKLQSLLLSVAATLSLTACIDTRDPIQTIKSMAYAAKKNNLKDFQATFHKDVRETLGTQEIMEAIKTDIESHAPVSVGPVVQYEAEQGYQGWGFWGDILRRSHTSLRDDHNVLILGASIQCAVYMDRLPHSGTCLPSDPNCGKDGYRYVESQDCRIIALAMP